MSTYSALGFLRIAVVGIVIGSLSLSELSVKADVLPTCRAEDFHYEYTECDSDGGRWRVSVPKQGVCMGGAPNAPKRGRDCSFTCSAGHRLDMNNDQNCEKCEPGKYSLGGGVRFDNWTKLPIGFAVKAETFTNDINLEDKEPVLNCSKTAGWQARGDVIAAFTGHCTALLSYSAKLVRAGEVSFKYKYTDENTIFHFYVQNDMCQAYHDRHNSNVWPKATTANQWRTHTMELKSGLNILYWKAIGIRSEDSTELKPVQIKEIEISGVAFTSECSPCPPGMFSKAGASVCTMCPVNTFSTGGAKNKCNDCNVAKEYSLTGAEKCLQRSACTAKDFYSFNTPCDGSKKTHKVYNWIKPHICRTDLAGAVQLPSPTTPEKCPPCNPGMMLNSTGSCVFCPKNHFSKADECTQCPVNTVPLYGLFYNWWNEMPPNMTESCMSMDQSGCAGSSAWELNGEFIRTGRGHSDDAYLMLSLHTSGFIGGDNSEKFYGEVTFVFETSCKRNCTLFFIQEDKLDGAKVIKSWDASQKKQSFTYKVPNPQPATFNWAFEKVSWEMDILTSDRTQLPDDYAILHSINVTNTAQGGASECKPCPKGVSKDGCIPCPIGSYIDKTLDQCVKCPPGTVVSGRMMYGKDSCKTCGEGLTTKNSATCYSTCNYTSTDGKVYDFSKLNESVTVSGTRLFTTSGTQYYHHFNLSLCGDNTHRAVCANNFTSKFSKSSRNVHAYVCRSTIIPSKNPSSEATLSAQPTVLGDVLVNITSNHDNKTKAKMNKILTAHGWAINEDDTDVHFNYQSEVTTPACPHGRLTTITLRCDVKEKRKAALELPPKCPDGTCDGCNFNIIWLSRSACPKCKDEDYDVVEGECKNGDQVVYYYPPKHCILSGTDNKPKTKHQSCPLLPFIVQVVLLVIGAVGVLMCIVIVYCWKRNKRLEYKYMKLIHSSSKDGELPAAETCALDENEEDEHFDTIQFRESKGKKFFNKLKAMAGKNDNNPFESIKLTDDTFKSSGTL